jgi:hypothetical protein
MIAMMTVPSYAYPLWNFDSDSGDYIFIEAGVAGNWHQGKLYNPDAYIYVYIHTDLPDNYVLVLFWHFWWVDENFVVHEEFDTEDFPGYRYKGQSVRIEPSGLPDVVIVIMAEGRAGYDAVWDTRKVLASLPFVMS